MKSRIKSVIFEVIMSYTDPDAPAWDPLLAVAWQAWERAYAPYSGFHVGAALLLADGTIVPGCNVENASYPVAQCAERTAIGAAVTRGLEVGGLRALVVVTEAATLTSPCGACRQVLAEFAEELPILLANRTQRSLTDIRELLPKAFTGRDLAR
jgi:cytidine deaminase